MGSTRERSPARWRRLRQVQPQHRQRDLERGRLRRWQALQEELARLVPGQREQQQHLQTMFLSMLLDRDKTYDL